MGKNKFVGTLVFHKTSHDFLDLLAHVNPVVAPVLGVLQFEISCNQVDLPDLECGKFVGAAPGEQHDSNISLGFALDTGLER